MYWQIIVHRIYDVFRILILDNLEWNELTTPQSYNSVLLALQAIIFSPSCLIRAVDTLHPQPFVYKFW
jgi:hypothetical protein